LELKVGELVAEARSRLASAPFRPSTREAFLLLGRVLGWSEVQVIAREDRVVSEEDASRFRELLDRRLAGEPVAYLFSEREFYGRTFQVDRRVLVPRPETEGLVEVALEAGLGEGARVLDVGTGSGCIAVTVALERPGAQVVATDLSLDALDLARTNARRWGAKVSFVAADLGAPLDWGTFDLVLSNPPYLGREEAGELSPEVVAFEPHLALFAPEGGTALLLRLLEAARGLPPRGLLAMEIGLGQEERVRRLAVGAGLEVKEVRTDLAGIPRVVLVGHPAG
jgi:release factor glutamine methyltransferase